MSKKSLDESGIINELKGSSLFFEKQEESPAVQAVQKDLASTVIRKLSDGHYAAQGNPL